MAMNEDTIRGDNAVRILIADDDLTSRKMLAAMLEKCDYHVTAVDNGTDALRIMVEPDAPRVAVLDWMMPEVSGLDVCRGIRRDSPGNPPYIVMVTSKNEVRDIVEALEAGADDYLIKPYNALELRARIEVGRRIVTLQDRLSEKVRELNEALAGIRTLHGILPICSFCKKIRDDREGWRQLEEYVSTHSEAQFSHGICPECMKKMYPGYEEKAQE